MESRKGAEVLDRMRQVLDASNDSQLARALGVPRSTLQYCRDNDKIPYEACEKLAESKGISLDWLIFGQTEQAPQIADLDLTGRYPDRALREVGMHVDVPVVVRDAPADALSAYVFVPRYDVRVSAGGGAHIESEQIVDHLAFKSAWIKQHMRLNPRDLALVEVVGDSMEPTFGPEDLLLVDLGRRVVKDDGVYVLRRAGGLLAKRCQTLASGQLQLRSDNAAYSPELIEPESADDLDVIGRAVWAGRKL